MAAARDGQSVEEKDEEREMDTTRRAAARDGQSVEEKKRRKKVERHQNGSGKGWSIS